MVNVLQLLVLVAGPEVMKQLLRARRRRASRHSQSHMCALWYQLEAVRSLGLAAEQVGSAHAGRGPRYPPMLPHQASPRY